METYQILYPAHTDVYMSGVTHLLAAAEWDSLAKPIKWEVAQLPAGVRCHMFIGIFLFPICKLPLAKVNSAILHAQSLGWYFGYVPTAWAAASFNLKLSILGNWVIRAMAQPIAGIVHLPTL